MSSNADQSSVRTDVSAIKARELFSDLANAGESAGGTDTERAPSK